MERNITEVCTPCGITANYLTCLKKYGRPPLKKAFDVSTFHQGRCQVCLEETSVTEPRDFFYPDFELIFKKIKTVEVHRGGCLHCPGTEDLLALDTVLYQGFGGYTVFKNNEVYYEGDPQGDFESFKTLQEIEDMILVNPTPEGTAWKVVLNNPLRGATWKRTKPGKWELTETNLGFA